MLGLRPVPSLVALDHSDQLDCDRHPPRLATLGAAIPANPQLDAASHHRTEHQIRHSVRTYEGQATELRFSNARTEENADLCR